MLVVALIAILGLALLLANTLMQRLADRLARVYGNQTSGTAFDSAAVQLRIRAIRENYLAALETRARTSNFHDELLASAHRALSQLPFFQSRKRIQP